MTPTAVSTRDFIIRFTFLFFVHFALAQFALFLFRGGAAPAVVYLPAAIGLAALVLWGLEYWPAIALASFLSPLIAGVLPPVALGLSLAHTLQALVGAYFLRYWGFQPLMGRLYDLTVFVGVAVVTAMIVPSLGLFLAYVWHTTLGTALPSVTWLNWWVGELFSLLIFAPFFIRWIGFPKPYPRTRLEWVEALFTLFLVFIVSWVLFWTPTSTFVGVSMIYLLFLPLFWISIRTGPRFLTLALVMIAVLALVGAPLGVHPPTSTVQSLGQRIFSIELFMIFIAAIYLTLTSLSEERKDATKRLREHVDELEVALERISREDSAKSEFLATLAHELRNPLSPIISSVEILELNSKKGEHAQNESHVQSIKTHVHMIRSLLEDILDISRITKKGIRINKRVVELTPIIESSRQTVASFYAERDHRFGLSLPQGPVWLEADPIRLQQIIINLLYNAGKYTKPGGTIKLSVERTDGEVHIRVKDNGIGIAEEMLERIFEPFVQVREISQMGTGLGIGLSLTKRLTELHGGTIRVESAGLGQGSTFTLTFPVSRNVPLPMQAPEPRPARTNDSPRLSVFLVDDNEPAAESLSTLLRHHGYPTKVAYNGTEALTKIEEVHPDVVILDIGLPDMDGYAVARSILAKNLSQKPTLVALTGYGQEEDKRKAREAGFVYHLTKPIGIADVQVVLDKIARSRLKEASVSSI